MEEPRKEKLIDLKNQYGQLSEEGRRLQEYGLELTKLGALGQMKTQILVEKMPEIEEVAVDNKDLATDFENLDRVISLSKIQLPRALDRAKQGAVAVGDALRIAQISAYTTSSQTAVVGWSIHGTFLKNPELIIKYGIKFNQSMFPSVDQSRLDELLEKFKAGLSKKRKGVWDAFHSVSSDRFAQAATSMKNILSLLISSMASNPIVKKATWWAYDDSGKDGVILRQRFRFLLFGPEPFPANTELEELMDRDLDNWVRVQQGLNDVAHGKNQTEDGVLILLRSTEEFLLQVLERKEELRPLVPIPKFSKKNI